MDDAAGDLCVSFSGLKTALLRYVQTHPDLNVPQVAASYQEAIVQAVADRTCIRDCNAKVRLYDVKNDPFQSKDLASDPDRQDRLEEMTVILDSRLRP